MFLPTSNTSASQKELLIARMIIFSIQLNNANNWVKI